MAKTANWTEEKTYEFNVVIEDRDDSRLIEFEVIACDLVDAMQVVTESHQFAASNVKNVKIEQK